MQKYWEIRAETWADLMITLPHCPTTLHSSVSESAEEDRRGTADAKDLTTTSEDTNCKSISTLTNKTILSPVMCARGGGKDNVQLQKNINVGKQNNVLMVASMIVLPATDGGESFFLCQCWYAFCNWTLFLPHPILASSWIASSTRLNPLELRLGFPKPHTHYVQKKIVVKQQTQRIPPQPPRIPEPISNGRGWTTNPRTEAQLTT